MAKKNNEINIQFKVENAEYKQAMSEMRQETTKLNKEFKLEQEQMKLNGTEAQKLESRMKYLGDKKAIAAKEIKATEEQLERAKKQYGENSAEVEKLESKLTSAKITHQQINNELQVTEGRLKDVTNGWKNAQKGVEDFGKKAESAGKKLAPLSAAAGAALGGMVGLAVKAGHTADEINTLSKQTGLATDTIQKMKIASDLVDVSFETIQNSLTRVTRSIAGAADGSGKSAEAFEKLKVSFEENGQLRDAEAVFYDVIDALGEIENVTERDAIAMELFGRSAQDLNPLILGGADALREMGRAAEERGLIMTQEELDKANEFNDILDTLKAEGMQTLMQLGVEIGQVLLPALQSIAVAVSGLMERMREMNPETLQLIMVVLAIVAGLAPLLIIIGKVAAGISALMGLISALGPVIALLSGPVGWVIAAIAAVIAIGVLLYKNWDTIKEKAGALFESIAGIFGNIRDAISGAINTAKDTVKAAIDAIKGFFDFEWSLPKLKMPKIAMEGGFSLAPPRVPKFSIKWNADGAIFTKPTIFNTSQGLQGVGEAGPEAVLPISKLADLIRDVMPDRSATTSRGYVDHDIHGDLNVNVNGTGAAALANNRALANAVFEMLTDHISNGNRAIPNQTSILGIG